MRGLCLIAAVLALGGCATMNYLSSEYGDGQERTGEVTLADGSTYWVWEHRTKPKIMISIDAKQALGMGAVSGLTFGGAGGAIPPPIFEQVAARWFAERRPTCRLARGIPIDRMYYEVEYVCAQVAAAPLAQQAPAQKPKR